MQCLTWIWIAYFSWLHRGKTLTCGNVCQVVTLISILEISNCSFSWRQKDSTSSVLVGQTARSPHRACQRSPSQLGCHLEVVYYELPITNHQDTVVFDIYSAHGGIDTTWWLFCSGQSGLYTCLDTLVWCIYIDIKLAIVHTSKKESVSRPNIKTITSGIGAPIINIRRCWDRLIVIMGFLYW